MRQHLSSVMTWCLQAGALAVLCAAPLAASPILWTLQNVTFAGGGTATGSFVANVDTGKISDWNIVVSGLQHSAFDQDFNQSGDANLITPQIITFQQGADLLYHSRAPLSDLGGTVPIVGYLAESANGVQSGIAIAGGELVDGVFNEVPEPAPWLLLGTGLLFLLGFGYRRRGSRGHGLGDRIGMA